MTAWLFWSAILGLFASCEKEVEIVPNELETQVVVEATIENGKPPIVYLTNSLGFFSTLSVDDLAKSFIRNALITVQDGAKTVTLKEYAIPMGTATFYYYSVDSSNPAQIMVGQLGASYRLNITIQGKNYTAQTTIPQVSRKMDSVWWTPAPSNPDTNKVVIFTKITDPKGFGNYVRYFTSVNDSAFLPGLNSVYDDQIIDGTTYDAQVYRGVDRNVEMDEDEFGYFKKGEKVDIKLCNIDKATFDFWRTWEQNQSNIGNPFGVPVKILSNLSDGAIGYFGGYASQVVRIQIPR
ncbi:MAG TPA: DUF4249 domain-containing protein [Phnomibacter sp.]|nr:DUF4249 domain-containing protein [Phnomibacter sp.]